MTLLRYSLYATGGFLLTIVWVIGYATFGDIALSPTALVAAPLIGVYLLYWVDRMLHAALFGYRVAFKLNEYIPCPMCPFTKEGGTVLRYLLIEMHGGPYGGTMVRRLPLLVTAEVARNSKDSEMHSVPGFRVARLTHERAVVYLRDRDFYMAFLAANERALV